MERINKRKLIYLVRANPGLYNKYHPQYQKKNEKQQLWVEISKQMNFPVSICKMKWNNLRDCHRRAMIKNENTYKYSKDLEFLNQYMHGYELKCDYQNGTNSDEVAWGEAFSEHNDEDGSSNETKEQISDINGSCQQTLREPGKFDVDFNDHGNLNPLLWTDHVDSFLSGIAPVLKCLSRYNLCKAKAEIFQVVSKYELKSIQEESDTAGQSTSSDKKD